jgi:hypothetical protein
MRPQLLNRYLRCVWTRAHIKGAHAHRFHDTFAVKILEEGGTLYDVSHLLGISHRVAEVHYTPYVRELQERGRWWSLCRMNQRQRLRRASVQEVISFRLE